MNCAETRSYVVSAVRSVISAPHSMRSATSAPDFAAIAAPRTKATAEMSTAVTRQPRSASQIASAPSPLPTSKAARVRAPRSRRGVAGSARRSIPNCSSDGARPRTLPSMRGGRANELGSGESPFDEFILGGGIDNRLDVRRTDRRSDPRARHVCDDIPVELRDLCDVVDRRFGMRPREGASATTFEKRSAALRFAWTWTFMVNHTPSKNCFATAS